MNERIKELLVQATAFARENVEYSRTEGFDIFTEKLYEVSREKFAELIVRECLKQIKDGMVDESELLYEHEETTECVNEALMDAHHNIAIHFGVEE